MQRQIALTLAHSLMKARHLEREEALRLAWQVARADKLRTRVHGVSFGNRQRLLQRLAQYSPELVQITLVRDKNNQADRNAIAVVATVAGKGSAVIGYIRKTAAQVLAPVLDRLGGRLEAHLEHITCGNTCYGATISFSLKQCSRERAA